MSTVYQYDVDNWINKHVNPVIVDSMRDNWVILYEKASESEREIELEWLLKFVAVAWKQVINIRSYIQLKDPQFITLLIDRDLTSIGYKYMKCSTDTLNLFRTNLCKRMQHHLDAIMKEKDPDPGF